MAIDKHALIARVKELEDLTNDEKSQIIGFIKTKTYGLVWEDSTEKCWEQLKEYIPVLIENKERAIISDKPEAPNHILIEGDNLLALTNLCATHQGKIDVIYIDPPYNTGNKDFVYNDSYVDSEDAFRHSKWLSFMSKRLRIAKQLLSDRGVIFISIDDNEQANLKLLCDDKTLFGAQNLICQFIWQQGRKSMAAQVAINHEYCLVYAKNRNLLLQYDSLNENNNWSEKKEGLVDIYTEYNRLKLLHGDNYSAIETGIRKFYRDLPSDNPAKRQSQYKCVDAKGLYFPGDIAQGTGNGGRFDIIHPITGRPCKVPKGGWRFSEAKLPELLAEGKIHFGDDETKVPCLKRYLVETEYEVMQSVFYKDGRGATKRLEQILGGTFFDHPKDEDIIAMLIRAITSYYDNREYIILDFFAGSGTTLHAVMQQNNIDGRKRKCILVTNNENSICENVTYERNKRVINGYTKPNGEWVEGLHDNNLRYYKVGFVPRDKDLRFVTSFAINSVNTLCIKHGVYAEQPQFGSLQCTAKRLRYFDDGVRRFLVIIDPELVGDVIAQLQQAEYDGRMPVYVFTTGSYPYTDDFGQVSDRVELYPYPTCIYGACEQVMPRTVDKPLDMPDDIELTDDEANMTYDDLNKE